METFDYPDGDLPEIFWDESCNAVIKEGRLFVDADTTGYNNINFFFMYSDPLEKHLRQSAHERETDLYSLYHHLNGYIFTNVTNGNELEVRYRLRDNPGFNLVDEAFVGENRIGKTHHIKIVKIK